MTGHQALLTSGLPPSLPRAATARMDVITTTCIVTSESHSPIGWGGDSVIEPVSAWMLLHLDSGRAGPYLVEMHCK